jgi:hypothetical protein
MGLRRSFLSLQARYSPQNFTENIGKALDILKAEVWRLGLQLLSSSTMAFVLGLRHLWEATLASCFLPCSFCLIPSSLNA